MSTKHNELTVHVHCYKFSCSFCLHAVSMYLVISEFLRGLFRRVSFLKGLICGQNHESKLGRIMVILGITSSHLLTSGFVSHPISCASVWGKSNFPWGISRARLYTSRYCSTRNDNIGVSPRTLIPLTIFCAFRRIILRIWLSSEHVICQ